MKKQLFGKVAGKEIYQYTISSGDLILSVMELGATITELHTKDKSGKFGDVAVGFADAENYSKFTDNQGATIGRYANRIKGGKFTIDGKEYHIPCNDGNNMLHGNNEFRDDIWTLCSFNENSLEFSYTSPDGTNGFPGTLETKVKFTLNGFALEISYDAVSDKKTPICLTNHLYFNLTGDASKTIKNHTLVIDADTFTQADSELIPTGEILPVTGTALDFRTEKPIGRDIEADETVKGPGGYDMNFCLNNYDGTLKKCACLTDPESGRKMEVYTDLPGMQVYSGNWLSDYEGKGGVHFRKHGAVCLETQYYPDSPNHSNFPNCVFKAGEHFISTTVYKFVH